MDLKRALLLLVPFCAMFLGGCSRLDEKLVSPVDNVRQKARDDFRLRKDEERQQVAQRLVARMDSESVETRKYAAETIGTLGPKYIAAAEASLSRATQDKEPSVRLQALQGIKNLEGGFDALTKALSDSNDSVRGSAITALGEKGGKAIPPLLAFFEKASDSDRRLACTQLVGLSKQDSSQNVGITRAFDSAGKAYLKTDFDAAKFMFQQLAAVDPKDGRASAGLRQVEIAVEKKNHACNAAYADLDNYANRLLLGAAANGAISGMDATAGAMTAHECEKACASVGVNCVDKWAADERTTCTSIGGMGMPGETESCLNVLNTMVSAMRQ